MLIGLLVAGAIGFYIGRKTAPKAQNTTTQLQPQTDNQQPAQPGGGTSQGSPAPSGSTQPAGGQSTQQRLQ
ncbi:hypothetical protein A3F65_03585 [Candidatus Saccharibacteria bacterium RIFCSPHIGHO2_12_FULL_47_16b]|nr:MAG: hypothetical protein A3F65_03585 [Candidatus Saccharibacteria bacterium RIFCSPHIGHO2_12_FULL_47_16b]